jgi:hypothetical protein
VEVRLFKLDAEGATMPRVVATGVFSASFTPDAKHLVLIGETPRILRLEDGSSSPLLDLEKSQLVDRDTEAWFGGYSFVQFAPDRSFVVFGMDTQRAARMTFDGVTYEAVKKLTKMGGQR